MKLGILGAGGRSGVYVVEEALRRGHTVVAGVRGAHPFTANKRLQIIECNILDPIAVDTFIGASGDAVISVIGHVKNSPPRLQTEGMQLVIEAMYKHGKMRIICLTGTGVRVEGDSIPWYDRFLNMSITLLDRNRVEDGIAHAELLKQSKLEWTILRVLKLQNTNAGHVHLTEHGPTKLYVSRLDVASALLDVAEHQTFIRQMPILSK